MKTEIINLVKLGLQEVPELAEFLDDQIAENAVERTKDLTHGDFSSNIAMRFAKVTKNSPRDLASIIIKKIPESKLIKKIEIAGPGFINFHMSDVSFHQEISKIIDIKDLYGKNAKKKKFFSNLSLQTQLALFMLVMEGMPLMELLWEISSMQQDTMLSVSIMLMMPVDKWIFYASV